MDQHVIAFHYTLTDKAGQVLDSSEGQDPLIFLSGVGQIIPGLETVLAGLTKGEKKTVTVPAAEAYGVYDERLAYTVQREKLPAGDIKIGDAFEVNDKDQYFQVRVVGISPEGVRLDGNHPLAGQDLTFAVDMVDIRPATSEEVAHGHVHGAGGHHH